LLSVLIFIASAVQAADAARNVGENARQFGGGEPAVPIHPDQKTELALKIRQPFTVVAVGDLLQFQPFADSNDPDVKYLLDLIRKADLAVGDLENEIFDFDNFAHAGLNLATKEVADDWAKMGIDMVSRANNKDQRNPGVWEDFRQVERVGIAHAGVAHSLPEARMARYRSTPKGLAGFAGIYAQGGIDACCAGGQSVYVTTEQLAQVRVMKTSIIARRTEVEVPIPLPKADSADAVDLFGLTFRQGPKPAIAPPPASPRSGSPGLDAVPGPLDGVTNALHLKLFHGVTTSQMAQLRAMAGDAGTGPDLAAFGTQFRVMDKPGEHSFDMDPRDRREILEQIRTGKQASDIMVTNTHWHQNRYDFQAYSYDHFPADFEIRFAHDAIDQGDDVFVAQGVHALKGVEIYKGRPIFYGTSNFIFQNALMPLPKGKLPLPPGDPSRDLTAQIREATGAGAADAASNVIAGEHETQGFWQLRTTMEAILTSSHFENGRLTEVRLYPVDLGQTLRPGSQVGIPRRPTAAIAAKILDEVVEYSKPFGTKIEVKGGVGIIRIPQR
jgi:hypothetical protein